MMSFTLRVGLVLCLWASTAQADINFRNFEDPDAVKWAEGEYSLPAFPSNHERWIEFYVSATATNRFFIDADTLTVSKEGVVRYVLIVKTSGGATNITFEGIRCGAYEYRLYATGRQDATWVRSRTDQWRPIENKPVNRHHAMLNREILCPVGVPISSPEDGRNALRLGKHPLVP
ncbi:MAG: CNP1-like family protein [Rhodocyclaceae bacterium]|nr:CNP1-like family protein [Rhodocyclaceae bacterium]